MKVLIAIENEIIREGVVKIMEVAFPNYYFYFQRDSKLDFKHDYSGVIASEESLAKLEEYNQLSLIPWLVILSRQTKIDFSKLPGKPTAVLDLNCASEEIIFAWNCLLRDKPFVCGTILSESTNNDRKYNIELNLRELRILQCIAKGMKTPEIADLLFLSHHTINSYRKNLLKKFEVKSPVELVVKAIKESYIAI
jgi:DNA-binding NarL/FixJ family response regulator